MIVHEENKKKFREILKEAIIVSCQIQFAF